MRKVKKFLLTGFSTLLFFSLLLNLYLAKKLQDAQIETGTFKVIKVIDGDTFILEGDQAIRLADIDAPEKDMCLGKEAKEYLIRLILNKRVRLSKQVKGTYDRVVSMVYVGEEFVNKSMLERGFGRYDSGGTVKDKELKLAANRAGKQELGVYSKKCTQKEPPNQRCSIKGNIDKHYGGKIYHFNGCSGYRQVILELDRGEQWFCSEKEAEAAGYTKSKTCYGKSYQPSTNP